MDYNFIQRKWKKLNPKFNKNKLKNANLNSNNKNNNNNNDNDESTNLEVIAYGEKTESPDELTSETQNIHEKDYKLNFKPALILNIECLDDTNYKINNTDVKLDKTLHPNQYNSTLDENLREENLYSDKKLTDIQPTNIKPSKYVSYNWDDNVMQKMRTISYTPDRTNQNYMSNSYSNFNALYPKNQGISSDSINNYNSQNNNNGFNYNVINTPQKNIKTYNYQSNNRFNSPNNTINNRYFSQSLNKYDSNINNLSTENDMPCEFCHSIHKSPSSNKINTISEGQYLYKNNRLAELDNSDDNFDINDCKSNLYKTKLNFYRSRYNFYNDSNYPNIKSGIYDFSYKKNNNFTNYNKNLSNINNYSFIRGNNNKTATNFNNNLNINNSNSKGNYSIKFLNYNRKNKKPKYVNNYYLSFRNANTNNMNSMPNKLQYKNKNSRFGEYTYQFHNL